ncbi:MAG: competence protein ComEA [Eubacteriaceae bacterium]|nr:competence protein ComEA [Eubacteriaceae bacterium]MDK2937257.1 competence protein ComEA [Eubacteriaceae bacterium]
MADGKLNPLECSMDIHRNKLLYILIVLVFLGVFWAWYLNQDSQESEIIVSESAESSESLEEPAAQIMVHVTGAVNAPGLISLPSGARLMDAVSAAGGFSETADQSALNLARKIKDEEQIVIPVIGDASSQSGVSTDGRVNINTADLEELKSLPGIGDVIAQNIIDYREENGSFTQLEDLKNVTRIGDKIYESISESITL